MYIALFIKARCTLKRQRREVWSVPPCDTQKYRKKHAHCAGRVIVRVFHKYLSSRGDALRNVHVSFENWTSIYTQEQPSLCIPRTKKHLDTLVSMDQNDALSEYKPCIFTVDYNERVNLILRRRQPCPGGFTQDQSVTHQRRKGDNPAVRSPIQREITSFGNADIELKAADPGSQGPGQSDGRQTATSLRRGSGCDGGLCGTSSGPFTVPSTSR